MNTFTWIDFLNEACTWENVEQAESFLSGLSGKPVRFYDADIKRISDVELLLRNQLAALHFAGDVDYAGLNEHLGRVQLFLKPHSQAYSAQSSAQAGQIVLPSLQAFSHEESVIDRFVDTMLVHFVSYVSNTLDGSSPHMVYRCEAMYRKGSLKDALTYYEKNRSLENAWKQELGSEYSKLEDLDRCCDFFVSVQRGKFCSDNCRFSAYALKRQQQDPDYQAQKQRRYRLRQKKKNA